MADLYENLEMLQEAAKHPRAQMDKYLARGKKVVGCFAPFTPEELVHACGMIPMGMWGGRTPLKRAGEYLPAFACSLMQADMEFALSGVYDGMSAVIIPAICDTLRCMTQNWRFGVTQIPMIPIVWPQNREAPESLDYLISEYEQVLYLLTAHTGLMMKDRILRETIGIYNDHNAAMREFAAAAKDHPDVITPVVRHTVMKSAWFFEKKEHTEIVREIVRELKELPIPAWSGKKAVLTGILCEPVEILQMLEENGIAVAGDDLLQESMQYQIDTEIVKGRELKCLAEKWMKRKGCMLIHETGKPRGAILAKLCRDSGADAVISCLVKFCDPDEYDQPYLVKDLKQEGIPFLQIEVDQLRGTDEQLRTKIETFRELLG